MRSTEAHILALALDPVLLFELRDLTPDPWQCELLRSTAPRILLNCARQAGKSTTVAALAFHTALFTPRSLVLLLSRSLRQSGELFRKVLEFHTALTVRGGAGLGAARKSSLRLELANGSRIISLPGQEGTLRGYSGVRLLLIDEAARVPDALYKAVRPMLAVSGGRLVCLSTPFGRRGFFYEAWQNGGPSWLRFEVRGSQVARIPAAFLEEELHTLGRSWYNQEYGCSFEALEGLVYPDFRQCVVDAVPPAAGKLVGGMDFGFRNPFAAVWGFRDDRDVLWLIGEHYERQQPLHRHAARLPRSVHWYADPAGANEIAELRCAGFRVTKGDNALRAGIAAVTARVQTGRLKVLASACPNLIAEAGLYRYPSRSDRALAGENPIDENNHALAALRYLISRLDYKFLVTFRKGATTPTEIEDDPSPVGTSEAACPHERRRPWLDPRNEELWTPLF
jgi:hypothetical protein